MQNTIHADRLQKSVPLYRQVEAHFLDRIRSGEIAAGMKLPSNTEIAVQTGVSVFSVQRAMQNLVRSGLIERRQRAGTFVKGNGIRLACAGIYLGRDIWHEPEHGFYIALVRELQQVLTAHHVDVQTWPDPRSPSAHSQPLSVLKRAVENREIQALLVPLCDTPELHWLRELDIPTVFNTDARISNRVDLDFRQMFHLACQKLHARGCRSVGLISNTPPVAEARTTIERYAFRNAFLDMAREFDLAVRDEWTRLPVEEVSLLERYGHEQFHALRQLREQPDGLVVYPDTVAKGVLLAILELGVRVPQDLCLVLHRNRGVDFVCPLPAAWLETDVAATAAAMFQQIASQLTGESPRPIFVPFAMRSV